MTGLKPADDIEPRSTFPNEGLPPVKKFTVGVTTYNESENVQSLLTELGSLPRDLVDVIVYDDCSTDTTRRIIEAHDLFQQENFEAVFAEGNSGGPTRGRNHIAQRAESEYVTLIDGDDTVSSEALVAVLENVDSGNDLIISPYVNSGRVVGLDLPGGRVPIRSDTITGILSSIGGKIYNRDVLRKCTRDPVVARSDDVRINLNLLLSGFVNIQYIKSPSFYYIRASRKSRDLSKVDFQELRDRVIRYDRLAGLYGLDRRYLHGLKRTIANVVRESPAPASERARLNRVLSDIFHFDLKRIVFLTFDATTIGGISNRVRKTMAHSGGRSVEYVSFSNKRSADRAVRNHYSFEHDGEEMLRLLSEWSPSDTVIITVNNVLRTFTPRFRRRAERFALIHMSAGQMAFMVQDQTLLADPEYVEGYRASRIVSFSDMDISFQRQLGIHGQVKVWLPVEVREENAFSPEKNLCLGYVGRIDFHAKAADRLLDVAESMRLHRMPPMKVFTTSASNSPDYAAFMERVRRRGLDEQFDFVVDCEDRDEIYREISVLVLPSKKESFGNVILEAYSYGIPVIAASYAPGPAELIEHGETGFLLDEFSGDNVVELVAGLTPDRLARLSAQAFAKHKRYGMADYLDLLERMSTETLNDYLGRNELQVFPRLQLANAAAAAKAAGAQGGSPGGEDEAKKLASRLKTAQAELKRALAELQRARAENAMLQASTSWKATAPARAVSRAARKAIWWR